MTFVFHDVKSFEEYSQPFLLTEHSSFRVYLKFFSWLESGHSFSVGVLRKQHILSISDYHIGRDTAAIHVIILCLRFSI